MIDTQYFKQKLEKERERLEKELGSIGRINPSNPKDWEPVPAKMDIMDADKNEKADAVEEFGTRTAIEIPLESRLNNIKAALKRIENNNYGICSVCEKEIGNDRLEANSSATTCKEHLNA